MLKFDMRNGSNLDIIVLDKFVRYSNELTKPHRMVILPCAELDMQAFWFL